MCCSLLGSDDGDDDEPSQSRADPSSSGEQQKQGQAGSGNAAQVCAVGCVVFELVLCSFVVLVSYGCFLDGLCCPGLVKQGAIKHKRSTAAHIRCTRADTAKRPNREQSILDERPKLQSVL